MKLLDEEQALEEAYALYRSLWANMIPPAEKEGDGSFQKGREKISDGRGGFLLFPSRLTDKAEGGGKTARYMAL